jgi:protein gp37
MGDLFHASVQFDWLHSIFAYMMTPQARKHIFLILTKRPDAMARYLNGRIPIGWPLNKPEFSLKEQGPWRENLHPHIWFGVSVENQRTADERIPILLQIPAAKRFVSVEPMLGPTDLSGWLFIDEKGDAIEPPIYWIICGGETGPGARLMHPDWIRLLRDQSQASGVPFFFKSWGDEGEWEELACGHRYQKQGRKSRELDGRIWEERPA